MQKKLKTTCFQWRRLTLPVLNSIQLDQCRTRVGISTPILSVSTSTQKNKFKHWVGYITDDGMIIRENLKKLTLTLSDEAKLNNNVK